MIWRVACLVVVVALAVQATGMTTIDRCWTICPDDDASGNCPDGNCCDCCLQGRVVVDRAIVAGAALLPNGSSPSPGRFVALTSDPRDILHVPLISLS